jgi:hypothetical protein
MDIVRKYGLRIQIALGVFLLLVSTNFWLTTFAVLLLVGSIAEMVAEKLMEKDDEYYN